MARQQGPEHELDPLLRQVLRSAPGGVTASCVDAETLAAWGDGTLRGDEQAAVMEHAADCARCRALLAALVRSDVPPVRSHAVADVPSDSAPVPFWRRWRLQWIAPVAATATALAVYIAAPEPPAPASQAAPAADTPRTDTPRTDTLRLETLQEPVAAAPTPPLEPQPDAAATAAKAPDAGFAPVPDSRVDSKALARTESREETSTRDRDTLVAQAIPPTTPAAAPPPEAAAPARGAARSAVGVASPDNNVGRVSSGLSESVADARRLRDGTRVRALSIAGSGMTGQWRINGTIIERSPDGVAWRPVNLPAGVDAAQLDAGAAADQRTIWLVGRGGLVLVSVDGQSFRRTMPPAAVDFVGAEVRDARSATVVANGGRRFDTADGGTTWAER